MRSGWFVDGILERVSGPNDGGKTVVRNSERHLVFHVFLEIVEVAFSRNPDIFAVISDAARAAVDLLEGFFEVGVVHAREEFRDVVELVFGKGFSRVEELQDFVEEVGVVVVVRGRHCLRVLLRPTFTCLH